MLGGFKRFHIDSRLQFGFVLMDCLAEQDESLDGKRAVEIGTGWAPILPMFFWLYGLKECHTFDILRLLRPTFIRQTALEIDRHCSQNRDLMTAWRNRNTALENRRLPVLRRLIEDRASPEAILRECGITYHAPADASQTGFSTASFDIVFSNLVLGEIPIKSLDAIFSEAYRVIRPGGFMLHVIDLGDQFAGGQTGITKVNFLKFSEKEFSKYNSVINFQNRLRAPDYRQLFEKHGFKILCWHIRIDQEALRHINDIKVHSDFSSHSLEDLCTNTIYVLAKRG